MGIKLASVSQLTELKDEKLRETGQDFWLMSWWKIQPKCHKILHSDSRGKCHNYFQQEYNLFHIISTAM